MIPSLASKITRAASTQTYYTIRFLVDHERVADAYRAYAYFRWVDDVLDSPKLRQSTTLGGAEARERIAFCERQEALLEGAYRGELSSKAAFQEEMLVQLVRNDHDKNSGLQQYLQNMMRVMDFDARRRGKLLTQNELDEYTHWLASAVTEALHYFIGHDDYAPRDERRYLAVSAAHIIHMLRDTFDDVQLGYYNVPREVLDANHIGPHAVHSEPYRAWVKSRVLLAREYFSAGKQYFGEVENARCRLACFAYIARFEWLLDTIEREGYCLRPQYNERKGVRVGIRMSWLTLASMISWRAVETLFRPPASHPLGKA
jgi:hypothetical protein